MGDAAGKGCNCCYPSYTCGPGLFQEGIQSMFPVSYAVNVFQKNGSKNTICGYPGLASYVHFQASSDAMAHYLASYILSYGYDGIYLDGYIRDTLWEKMFTQRMAGLTFDSDGDGQPDTIADAINQYSTWAPYFVYRLRSLLGPDKIILANSAGELSSPLINGLTIEMESCVDFKPCYNALVAQEAVGAQPAMSVMWLTHSESMPPEQQCERVAQIQKQLDWVYAGTDFFDRSHIVCNNSRVTDF